MEKGRNHLLFTPSGCLSEEGLMLYSRGHLSDDDSKSVENHLEGCALCRMAVEGFSIAGTDELYGEISLLNAGLDGLLSGEDKSLENDLPDHQQFEGPRFPRLSQEEVRQFTAKIRSKADQTAIRIPAEKTQSKPAGISGNPFQRYRFRIAAASVLLLAGFGSLMLFNQLKQSHETSKTASVIEKLDSITTRPVPGGISETTRKKKKEKNDEARTMLKDTVKTFSMSPENETFSYNHATGHVLGLIEKNDYSVDLQIIDSRSQGLPPAATPEIQQKVQAKKSAIPVIHTEAEEDTELSVRREIGKIDETELKALNDVKAETLSAVKESPEAEIFSVVEESPHFPGGEEKRIDFFQKNLKYPEEARDKSISGIVYVTFVVEPDGTVSDARVLRGIGGGCDEEALRVIRLMPKWIPGKQRGKAVRVQLSLQVNFSLAR